MSVDCRRYFSAPTFHQKAEEFFAAYANSKEQEKFALHLWGIHEAFEQIFGGLDGYILIDPKRRERYVQMIGANAIEALKSDDDVVALCNDFFMNYLVQFQGADKSILGGRFEQVSDRLDGIIRRGAGLNEKLASLEEKAKDLFASTGHFPIGSGHVVGALTERNVVQASQIMIKDLQSVLQTGDDYYWYMVEQHADLASKPSMVRSMLDGVPLFPIEYQVRSSIASYVGKPNSGIEYIESVRPQLTIWCAATVPQSHPVEIATRVICATYVRFRTAYGVTFDALRLEMAKQYCAQAIANQDSQAVSMWSEVIEALLAGHKVD